MKVVKLDKTSEVFEIDGLKCFRVENVASYSYEHCAPILNLTLHEPLGYQERSSVEYQGDSSPSPIWYFVLDNPAGSHGFGHWVYEAFIFYPILKRLREINPSIKIVASMSRNYMANLLKFFKLDDFELCTDLAQSSKNDLENGGNVCFFPCLSLNDMDTDVPLLKKLMRMCMDDIARLIPSKNPPEKTLLTILPRQSKDNYSSYPQDRIIPLIEDIKEKIVSKGGTVLDTYYINNMGVQFDVVARSKTIILDWGASMLVNGMAAKGAKIIVLDNFSNSWQLKFPGMNAIMDVIKENNTVVVLQPKGGCGTAIPFGDISVHL